MSDPICHFSLSCYSLLVLSFCTSKRHYPYLLLYLSTSDVLTFLCLETKKSNKRKFKAKPNAPLVWPGQRTRGLHNFVNGLNYRSDRTKLLLREVRNSWRRCLFRLQTSQL